MAGTGAPLSASPVAAAKLLLLGFLTLFLELSLIRYLAGSVWNLGYFPNLVLLAAFVGMGAGFVFHHRADERLSAGIFRAAPLLLLALSAFVAFVHPNIGFDNWGKTVGGELYFTGGPAGGRGDLALLSLWFLMVVGIFAGISQWTAKLFRLFPPLKAYTLDISGSCCGIAAFMMMSWLGAPPPVWFGFSALLFLMCARPGDRRRWAVLLPMAGVVLICARQDSRLLMDRDFSGVFEARWSPYQKVELTRSAGAPPEIFVNGIPHQSMVRTAAELGGSFYRAPHAARAAKGLPPYRNVLILGAGGGNDAAAALAGGAEHVDAVEIAPVIAGFGRESHPLKPYADPRVRVSVTDGRAFMTRSDRKYDLVVFALTDSLVKVSAMAQLRLENYLFTREAVARAFELLADGGDVVFYNGYRRKWLVEKLLELIRRGTGRRPEIVLRKDDFFVIRAGTTSPPAGPPAAGVEVPGDDWPFLYLRERGLPRVYAGAMAALALLVGGLLFVLHRSSRREERGALSMRLAFVLMGAAFLLLETKSIIQFGLLFGTTWHNTSLVFLAILLLVLAANWTAAVVRSRRLLWFAYGALVLSCGLVLVFPLAGLLRVESVPARFVLASLMTFAPVFFANLIFSASFRDARLPERLFGWNLIGATLGGILEYASMAFGYTALAVAVLVCYTLVLVLLVRSGASRRLCYDAPTEASS